MTLRCKVWGFVHTRMELSEQRSIFVKKSWESARRNDDHSLALENQRALIIKPVVSNMASPYEKPYGILGCSSDLLESLRLGPKNLQHFK